MDFDGDITDRERKAAALDALCTEVASALDPVMEYVCECDRRGCQQRVVLTVAEYGQLRRERALVLAPGHRSRPLEARATARRLQDEARALQAEARVQVARALRNLVSAKGHAGGADRPPESDELPRPPGPSRRRDWRDRRPGNPPAHMSEASSALLVVGK